jgi:hypothetical protein
MHLREACCQILDQLTEVTRQLDDGEYNKPSKLLSSATFGQHLRHTLEFFFCLEKGLHKNIVNYDRRERDEWVEQNRLAGLDALERVRGFVTLLKEGHVKLEVGYDPASDRTILVDSNVHRELIYNIEHAVHHMAIMKIGLRDVAPHVSIPAEFGVAASTLRHKDSALAAR